MYPDNHRFWNTDLYRLAAYLNSRKAVPSNTYLDALGETLASHAAKVQDVAEGAVDAVGDVLGGIGDKVSDFGDTVATWAKWGGLAALGLIVLPPVIRAMRSGDS